MANPGYVRSTDGDDADNGSTWALANATITGAAADDAAGDTIYFSHVHSEAIAGAISVTFGTNASPSKLICGNDAAEPPTAVATTAVIATTATSSQDITISGSLYAYGLTLKPGGAGAVNCDIVLAQGAGDSQIWDNCVFDVNCSGSGSNFIVGTNANQQATEVTFLNCDSKFGGTGLPGLFIRANRFQWRGGGFVSGTSTPSGGLLKLNSSGEGADIELSGVDLSNLASTVVLVVSSPTQSGTITFRNCKLPASWSGTLFSGGAVIGLRGRMLNCSAGDVNYALRIEDYRGTIVDETTVVKTSGASDGTTSLAWKMTTNANAEYPALPLASSELAKWNETVGSSITVTVDFLHDSVTNLQDDEIWLDVQYLGTSGFPLSVFVDDAAADFLTTPADQTTSAATWTTTGLTNPNEQKLSVSFTPQEKGLIIATVRIAKASYTVYIDPLLQVS